MESAYNLPSQLRQHSQHNQHSQHSQDIQLLSQRNIRSLQQKLVQRLNKGREALRPLASSQRRLPCNKRFALVFGLYHTHSWAHHCTLLLTSYELLGHFWGAFECTCTCNMYSYPRLFVYLDTRVHHHDKCECPNSSSQKLSISQELTVKKDD